MLLEHYLNGAIMKRIGPVSERTKDLPFSHQAGTAREWSDWTAKAKSECPFLFAVGEVWDNFTGWRDHYFRILWSDPFYYLRNRYINKTHLIDTGLPKGKWQEPNTRLLFAVMKLAEEHLERNNYDNPAFKLLGLWAHGKYVKDYVGGCPEETEYFQKAMTDIAPLVTAVLWWQQEYPQYEKTIEAMYDSVPLPQAGEDRWEVNDEARAIYEKIRQEEDRQVVEIKKHLKMVCECWCQLWD